MGLFHHFSKYLELALSEGQLQRINLLSGPNNDLCPATHFESGFWPTETEIHSDNFCTCPNTRHTKCEEK